MSEKTFEYNFFSSGVEVKPFDKSKGFCDLIHFLPTGTSDAILLESDGHFALVDCAEDTDNPRGFEWLNLKGFEDEVISYLKKTAADKDGKIHLDFILGTHAHSDHLGGFDTLIKDESFIIDRAYLKRYDESRINSYEREKWDNLEVYEQTVEALKSRNIPIIEDITETEFPFGNMAIKLFNTEYDTVHTDIGENDNAIGMLIEINEKRIFLAADIENETGDEDNIARILGKVDLLKVGHHSYNSASSVGFLKALDPEYCVVTNDYERADTEILLRIKETCHSPILVTGAENGVVAVFNKDKTISFYNGIM